MRKLREDSILVEGVEMGSNQKSMVGAYGVTLKLIEKAIGKAKGELKRLQDECERERMAREELKPECARRGLSLEECLMAVKRITDLGAEISRRENISKQLSEANSEKQKRRDELDQQIPQMEKKARHWQQKVSLAQRLHQEVASRVQYLSQQLSLLEKNNREQLDVALLLEDKKHKLREEVGELSGEVEKLEKIKNEIKNQLLEIQGAVKAAQAELGKIEDAKSEELNRIREWAKRRVEEFAEASDDEIKRLNEVAENLRLRVMALNVQLEEAGKSKDMEPVRLESVGYVLAKPQSS